MKRSLEQYGYDGLICPAKGCYCFAQWPFRFKCNPNEGLCLAAKAIHDENAKFYLEADDGQRICISNKPGALPHIRPEDINATTEQSILEQLVLHHNWLAVRYMAAKYVKHQRVIVDAVVQNDLPLSELFILADCITDQRQLENLPFRTDSDVLQNRVIDRIKNIDILLYLAATSEIPVATVLPRLQYDQYIDALVLAETEWDRRKQQIKYINDPAILRIFLYVVSLLRSQGDCDSYIERYLELTGEEFYENECEQSEPAALIKDAFRVYDHATCLHAIQQLRDPLILGRTAVLAVLEDEPEVALEALRRIDNQQVLTALIWRLSAFQNEIIKQITWQPGLACLIYNWSFEHADDKINYLATQQLYNQRALQLIAYRFKDWDIRKLAVSRIDELQLLQQLLEWQPDEQLFTLVSRRLHQLE